MVAEQDFLTVFFAEEASLPMRLRRAIVRRKARYDHAVQAIVRRCGRLAAHPRLVVFALLGMSNWTHKWYDPRGAWDAEFIADAFIALIERGYIATSEASRRDVARRLAELRGRCAPCAPCWRAASASAPAPAVAHPDGNGQDREAGTKQEQRLAPHLTSGSIRTRSAEELDHPQQASPAPRVSGFRNQPRRSRVLPSRSLQRRR